MPYTPELFPSGDFTELVRLLNKEQKIILVVDSHRGEFSTDWVEWADSDFAFCALNYEQFVNTIDLLLWPGKIIGYVLTSWAVASTMDDVVVDTHREIGLRLVQ